MKGAGRFRESDELRRGRVGCRLWQGHRPLDACSMAGLGLKRQGAAEEFDAVSQVLKSMMEGGHLLWIEATSVVPDIDEELIRGQVELDVDAGGLCVFQDIVEHLLHEQEEMTTPFAGQGRGGHLLRENLDAFDGGAGEGSACVLAKVRDEAVPGIVARIVRPDQFAHVIDGLPGDAGDLVDGMGRGDSGFELFAGDFAEESDTGEAGAQVIVEVPGNALPVSCPTRVVFQTQDMALEAEAVAMDSEKEDDGGEGAGELKSGPLVEEGFEVKGEGLSELMPGTELTADAQVEAVIAGWQVEVGRA